MRLQVFTSANLNYYSQCAALAESVRLHEPEAHLVLVLVNDDPTDIRAKILLHLYDEIVTTRELLGHRHDDWMSQYSVVEACTSVKGRALRKLLDRNTPVIYLDPDTYLFGSLDRFRSALNDCSILLTPHQVSTSVDAGMGIPDELDSLLFGIYNLGMLGARPTKQGKDFARWWDARLENHCLDDKNHGLFTDQKWINLVPHLFSETDVFTDPSVNLASWNLHNRNLTLSSDGTYLVDGHPLVLYHFTKIQSVGMGVSSQKILQNPLAADLVRYYLERLEYWAFGP